MKTAVVITARKGRGKHSAFLHGKILIDYPLDVAAACGYPAYVYTDDPEIADRAVLRGVHSIPRGHAPDAQLHSEAIQSASKWLMCESDYGPDDALILLLGNTTAACIQDITDARDALSTGADSALTVVEMHECHPTRALFQRSGKIRAAMPGLCARETYEPAYFWNGSVWATRMKHAASLCGPTPWVWLTEDAVLLKRASPFSFDYHVPADASAMLLMLKGTHENKT